MYSTWALEIHQEGGEINEWVRNRDERHADKSDVCARLTLICNDVCESIRAKKKSLVHL